MQIQRGIGKSRIARGHHAYTSGSNQAVLIEKPVVRERRVAEGRKPVLKRQRLSHRFRADHFP